MAQAVNGMAIEWVGTDSIAPAEWNVRVGHDVDGIAESITENQFRDPIEVWGEVIVAGAGRWMAAKQLGMETVPVIYHEFASLAAAQKYAIANNRETDKSEFDLPALEAQLAELDSLAGTGFDPLPDADPPPVSWNADSDDETADGQVCFRLIVPAAEADAFALVLEQFAAGYEWVEVTRRG